MHVLILSFGLVEEGGGPGVAVVGFAEQLVRRGARVTVIAAHRDGRWIVTAEDARRAGYDMVRLAPSARGARTWRMLEAARAAVGKDRDVVTWVNGIWGSASLVATALWRERDVPFVVRPAGSLGVAALRYGAWKKALYYRAIERPILRRAAALHCMSGRERDELPVELRPRAFVVPTGVDLPERAPPMDTPRLILGVLARVHPIKRHGAALDAVEALVRQGHDVELEIAGAREVGDYAKSLEHRVAASPALADRVRFLGHVQRRDVAGVVARWRCALLLSEQENFGHAVVTAAAAGVPTVVSPGVGLGADLARAGAGVVAEGPGVVDGARGFLSADRESVANRCRAFAELYGWDDVGRKLHAQLASVLEARRAEPVKSVELVGPDGGTKPRANAQRQRHPASRGN